jgi:ADP-heptose:LPS heptosyltransferase
MDALIIRPGALGDTLMALPALAAVEGRAAVSFAGSQPGLRFIQPRVHRISDLDGAGWHRLFVADPGEEALPLPAGQCVVAFLGDPDGRIRNNLVTRFPGTRVFVFPFLPPRDEPVHVARYIAERLKSAGIPLDPSRAMDRAVSSALIGAAEFEGQRHRLVLHPGSGDPKKNHPPDLWLEILARLQREEPFQDLQPVVLLGPAEEEILSEFQDRRELDSVEVQFCPGMSALTQILHEAALYMGHDSGITHLAAMMGAPTLALFKETRMDQWRPLGPRVIIVEARAVRSELRDAAIRAARSLFQTLS